MRVMSLSQDLRYLNESLSGAFKANKMISAIVSKANFSKAKKQDAIYE